MTIKMTPGFPWKYEAMILTTQIRACERCGEETMWARPRQRSLGHCLDHAQAPVDVPSFTEVLRTVATAFPGITAVPTGSPRYAPDVYGTERVKYVTTGAWLISGKPAYQVTYGPPPDAGPCEGCRRIVRRYGPEGYPYCTECEPVS